MPIIKSSFVEMSWRLAFAGKRINYNGTWVTIESLSFEPKTRQIKIYAESGETFLALKDDIYQWESENETTESKPNGKRIKKSRKNQ